MVTTPLAPAGESCGEDRRDLLVRGEIDGWHDDVDRHREEIGTPSQCIGPGACPADEPHCAGADECREHRRPRGLLKPQVEVTTAERSAAHRPHGPQAEWTVTRSERRETRAMDLGASDCWGRQR